MQLLLSLLSAVLVVPLLVSLGQSVSVSGINDEKEEKNAKESLIKNGGPKEQIEVRGLMANSEVTEPRGIGSEEDTMEDSDFEDDTEEESTLKGNLWNTRSFTHLHSKNGEILLPCFGMWWPVGGAGGGGGVYDYGGDYYGDYRKKRRRSKKQKKAARMKKKKA